MPGKTRKPAKSANPVAKGLSQRNRVAGPIPAKKGRGSVYTRRTKHKKPETGWS